LQWRQQPRRSRLGCLFRRPSPSVTRTSGFGRGRVAITASTYPRASNPWLLLEPGDGGLSLLLRPHRTRPSRRAQPRSELPLSIHNPSSFKIRQGRLSVGATSPSGLPAGQKSVRIRLGYRTGSLYRGRGLPPITPAGAVTMTAARCAGATRNDRMRLGMIGFEKISYRGAINATARPDWRIDPAGRLSSGPICRRRDRWILIRRYAGGHGLMLHQVMRGMHGYLLSRAKIDFSVIQSACGFAEGGQHP
jgi:hypothetical protein